jgi:hypothetical protein
MVSESEMMENPEWTLTKVREELTKAQDRIMRLEGECKEAWNLRAETIRAKEDAEKALLNALSIIAWLIKDVVR